MHILKPEISPPFKQNELTISSRISEYTRESYKKTAILVETAMVGNP
jgi:hypothetical protein